MLSNLSKIFENLIKYRLTVSPSKYDIINIIYNVNVYSLSTYEYYNTVYFSLVKI